MFITAKNLSSVTGADDLNLGGAGLGTLDQLLKGEPKGPRNAEGDSQSGIGFFALNLTEHAAAYATRIRQLLERPTPISAELFDTLP